MIRKFSVNKKIIIVSGGCPVNPEFLGKQIRKSGKCLIICCDGGARHLQNTGFEPDVIIGDMDSIDSAELAGYSREKIQIIKYPAKKDFTDTELALDYAIGLKPEKIFIWCALGGRIDHTLANIFLLARAQEKGIETILADEYCETFVLNKSIVFTREKGKTVSLIALTPRVTGITLSGFAYPLTKGSLQMGQSRGISNVIQNARAVIKIEKGKLLVIKYRQKNVFPEAL
jgi:thiamine pyrophosphokinase